jgi:hypothetical protein
VREVASKRLTTVSALLRQLLADVLRAEGFDVAKLRDEPVPGPRPEAAPTEAARP